MKTNRMFCRAVFTASALFIAAIAFAPGAWAVKTYPAAVMSHDMEGLPLGFSMHYLTDKEGKWTIEDVRSEKISAMFAPLGAPAPSFGHSGSARWLRLDIYNNSADRLSGILEERAPWIDSMDVYILKPAGGYDVRRSGALVPFSQREIPHRSFLFRLDFYPQETKTLYIRMESKMAAVAPFTLWRAEGFGRADAGAGYYFGFLLGALALLIFQALVSGKAHGEDIHYWFALYLFLGMAHLLAFNGFARMALWPDWPRFGQAAVPLVFLAFQAAGVEFTRRFLRMGAIIHPTDRLLGRMVKGYAALALISPLGLAFPAVNAAPLYAAMLFPLVLAWVCVQRFFDGALAARLPVLAWLASAIGAWDTCLALLGWTDGGYWGTRGLEAAATLGMTALMVAIMDRSSYAGAPVEPHMEKEA